MQTATVKISGWNLGLITGFLVLFIYKTNTICSGSRCNMSQTLKPYCCLTQFLHTRINVSWLGLSVDPSSTKFYTTGNTGRRIGLLIVKQPLYSVTYRKLSQLSLLDLSDSSGLYTCRSVIPCIALIGYPIIYMAITRLVKRFYFTKISNYFSSLNYE